MQNTIPTIIRKRFCGPPNSGNGGYVCGLLANALGEPAQVTLHAPPPLDTDLVIVRDADGARLLQGETLLGSARPYQFALTLPPAVSLADAEAARPRFSGYEQHGLPGCFVCGTDRCEHDGLLLHTGPVTGRDSTVACPWTPDSTLDAGDGTVAPEFVWAALDCPGYFAVKDQAGVALLGRFAAHTERPIKVGEQLVVTGWAIAHDGRKHQAGTAIYTADGQPVGWAEATWISLQKQAA